MDKTKRTSEDEPTMGRRAFFRGTLLTAGAAVTLFGLTACPGGDQEDGGDDDADDGGDDD